MARTARTLLAGLERLGLLLILGPTGCASTHPLLGVTWGADSATTAARLGVTCESWRPWEGGGEFETCWDVTHRPVLFGERVLVRLIRQRTEVVGMDLRFTECAGKRAALRAAIRREFHLEPGDDDPYHESCDRSLVHFACDGSDATCTLTVAGPRFGEAFARAELREGLAAFTNGLRAH